MTSEMAVLHEVKSMEENHELGTWQMRRAWQVELDVVAAAREQERLRAVDEKEEVQAQLVRAQVEQRGAEDTCTCMDGTRIQRYTHTCIHAYMHTCIHAYMHTCTHAHIPMRRWTPSAV